MRVQSHKSHVLRYTLMIVGFIWILMLGYLFYEYLVSKTDVAPTKGGTLIEGVTTHITYAPYVSSSPQDRFYQNFLFKSCQSFFTTGGQVIYEPDICSVITNDNKTFVVSIISTGQRSDGAPLTIDDVAFTYQQVLQKNIRDLPHGKLYDDLVIQKLSNNSLTITFPRASRDNVQFFTNFILPAHILADKNQARYIKNFATSPVTNGCASLSNSRDQSSVIFDLTNCKDTWLKYYQVKNTTLENIQKDPGIVDLYIGPGNIPGYNTGTIITNDYAGLFFNMKTGKLSIYGRKNIIALLNKYLYLTENQVPIVKEHFLFDIYPTSLTDKGAISTAVSFTGRDIPALITEGITIGSDTGNKHEYGLQNIEQPITMDVKFENTMPAKILTNDGVLVNLKISGKHARFTLEDNKNIFPGLNTFSFVDADNNILGNIDIYYKSVHMIPKEKRIHVVYYAQDTTNAQIAAVMRNITTQEQLTDYFYFDGKPTTQSYMDALKNKEYDITLQTLALGVKKDISSIFLSEDPLINPSLYVNPNLATQVKDFFQSSLQRQYSIKPLIDKLYMTDLPFFIIGKRVSYIHLKPDLALPSQERRDILTARYKLLHSLVLVHKPQVTKQDIINRRKFGAFILSEFGL